MGGGASCLQRALVRLLWLTVNGQKTLSEMPAVGAGGEFMGTATIKCGGSIGEVTAILAGFFGTTRGVSYSCSPGSFQTVRIVERRVIEAELENLQEFSAKQKDDAYYRRQMALL